MRINQHTHPTNVGFYKSINVFTTAHPPQQVDGSAIYGQPKIDSDQVQQLASSWLNIFKDGTQFRPDGSIGARLPTPHSLNRHFKNRIPKERCCWLYSNGGCGKTCNRGVCYLGPLIPYLTSPIGAAVPGRISRQNSWKLLSPSPLAGQSTSIDPRS